MKDMVTAFPKAQHTPGPKVLDTGVSVVLVNIVQHAWAVTVWPDGEIQTSALTREVLVRLLTLPCVRVLVLVLVPL